MATSPHHVEMHTPPGVCRESLLCSHRKLYESSTIGGPPEVVQIDDIGFRFCGDVERCLTLEGDMHAICVVVGLEFVELALEVERIPEEHMIKIFSTNSSDGAFDEGMRQRDVGHRFDFLDSSTRRLACHR